MSDAQGKIGDIARIVREEFKGDFDSINNLSALGIDAEDIYYKTKRVYDSFPDLREQLRGEDGFILISFNGKKELSNAVMIVDDNVNDSLTFLVNRNYSGLGSVLERSMISETGDYRLHVVSSELAKGSGEDGDKEAIYDLLVNVVDKNTSKELFNGVRECYAMENRINVDKFLTDLLKQIRNYVSSAENPNRVDLKKMIIDYEDDPAHNVFFHHNYGGYTTRNLPESGVEIADHVGELLGGRRDAKNPRDKLKSCENLFDENHLFEAEYKV